MNDLEKRKVYSVLCHGSQLLSYTGVSILVPILFLVISEDLVVQANAKESINLFINLLIYGVIFLILAFVLLGIPLLIFLLVASFILPIIAMVKVASHPDIPYRYPLVMWHFF
jgi:uncharacterized Tic20 family protein